MTWALMSPARRIAASCAGRYFATFSAAAKALSIKVSTAFQSVSFLIFSSIRALCWETGADMSWDKKES
jgi:hypothetical protein